MTQTFGAKLKNLVKRNNKDIPHVCFTCEWFRPNKPGGNRYCKFPGKINVSANVCLSWQLEPNPNKRVFTVIELQDTVQPTTT